MKRFPAVELIAWQKKEGRHGLPWQQTTDPYRRWLAEIMLQQTQVAAVIPYYFRFLEAFPTVEALAHASEDEVISLWAGLGYYSRARSARLCAIRVVEDYGGKFPMTVEELSGLPGIGPSTAGAVISAVTDRPEVVMDANVKRVFARFLEVKEAYGTRKFERKVEEEVRESLPDKDGRAYSQGLMDLGSMICRSNVPQCGSCPASKGCLAFKHGTMAVYPVKNPRKTKPKKSVYWLVAMGEGKIFLERRSQKGVWFHLWCLPEQEQEPENIIQRLPNVKHEFSHYKLTAKPCVVSPETLGWRSGGWFSPEEIKAKGVPTPIKQLLTERLF